MTLGQASGGHDAVATAKRAAYRFVELPLASLRPGRFEPRVPELPLASPPTSSRHRRSSRGGAGQVELLALAGRRRVKACGVVGAATSVRK